MQILTLKNKTRFRGFFNERSARMNVGDEKGKVEVWKGKNDSLHIFSPTRKQIYPFIRSKAIFIFRNIILMGYK